MRAAIYIDEGKTQVALTPENEWERAALKMIADSAGQDAKTFWVKFYETQGGYLREGRSWSDYGYQQSRDYDKECSLLFRIEKKLPQVENVMAQVLDDHS